jgi:hypothetical protein
MMGVAERDKVFVAYLAPKGPRMSESQTMRIGCLASASDQGRLAIDLIVPEPTRFWKPTARFVDLRRFRSGLLLLSEGRGTANTVTRSPGEIRTNQEGVRTKRFSQRQIPSGT